jgi:hypothetical protein
MRIAIPIGGTNVTIPMIKTTITQIKERKEKRFEQSINSERMF